MQSCAVLAQIYESSKKPTEAIYYLRLASLYQDTILEQSVQGSIQAKMFDLDLEKEKREKKQVLSVLTQRDLQVSRQRYILLSAGVALLSLLIIMFLIRKAGLQRQGINKLLMANNLQLNKLNQEVNGLINTIVHDLKSPLNSMQGLLYLLEQEAKENAEALLLIQQGNKVLTGGHEIIRQLLELRELEEKPPTVNPEEINLKEFMSALHEEHVNYSKQKKIELLTEASDTQVRIDRLLTKRLLTNLLSNAIKFSPSGKQVIMKATAHDAQVIFEIIDEGQGFTEADRQKVFQKFQKLSARPTAGESSHGLGLAIVHLLSQQLKATIDLKSESGKGATFTVSIPL
jgi:signal transduction histidine kinase